MPPMAEGQARFGLRQRWCDRRWHRPAI